MQAGVITAVDGVHYSFMCEKGFYSVYGFLLGALFAVLGCLLVYKLAVVHKETGGMQVCGGRGGKLVVVVVVVLFLFAFWGSWFCFLSCLSHSLQGRRRIEGEKVSSISLLDSVC